MFCTVGSLGIDSHHMCLRRRQSPNHLVGQWCWDRLWPTRLGVALALGHFHSRAAGLLKAAVFDTLAQ